MKKIITTLTTIGILAMPISISAAPFNDFGFNIKVRQKNIKQNKKVISKNYYYIKFISDADKII